MPRRSYPLPFFEPSDPTIYASVVRETTDRGPPRGLELTTYPLWYENERHMLSPPSSYMEFHHNTRMRGSPPETSLAFQLASLDRGSQGISSYPTAGRSRQDTPLALRLARAQSRPPPRLPPTTYPAAYSAARVSDRAPVPSRQGSLDSHRHFERLSNYDGEPMWITPQRRREVHDRTNQLVPKRAHSTDVKAGNGASLTSSYSKEGGARAPPRMSEATGATPSRRKKRSAREFSFDNPQPRKK